MVFSAVLDTSVLFPFYLRDTLLRVAAKGLYRPLWSQHILDELKRALVKKSQLKPPDVDRVVGGITTAFPDAAVGSYERLIDQVEVGDRDDRHVLAAAMTGGADVIVTANIRDFPLNCEEVFGVGIQSAEEFLLERLQEDFDRVTQALKEQVDAYTRSPRTVEELLERLGLGRFGRAVTAQRP